MDLSGIDQLVVVPLVPERVRLQWRSGKVWDSFEYLDEDSGYADDEDVLFWLLRHRAPLELVRTALGRAYPEFDVDAVLDFVTMPDRAERKAEDLERRHALKSEFRTRLEGP